MKRPAFQFYPADHRNNANVRRCSWQARGVWLELLCLLHDSDTYGVLAWTLKEIATALGAPLKTLNELAEKGVLKGSDGKHSEFVFTPIRPDSSPVTLIESGGGPCWFSSRMVIDEHKRNQRAEGGALGGSHGWKSRGGHLRASKSADAEGVAKPTPSAQHKGRYSEGNEQPPTSTSTSTSAVSDMNYEAKASAQPSPDRAKESNSAAGTIFSLGVPLLIEGGQSDKLARSILGKLRQVYGTDAVAEAVQACLRERPSEPVAWLTAACKHRQQSSTSALDDPRPQWAVEAGFADRFEAENSGCTPNNSTLFLAGKRLNAGGRVQPDLPHGPVDEEVRASPAAGTSHLTSRGSAAAKKPLKVGQE